MGTRSCKSSCVVDIFRFDNDSRVVMILAMMSSKVPSKGTEGLSD